MGPGLGWAGRPGPAGLGSSRPSPRPPLRDVSSVGGSPRGPVKQLGNPRLKPTTKPNTLYLTVQDIAHAAETPAAHQGGPLEDPLEQAPPRSRMRASLGRAPPCSRGCAYLERTPPRSRVRSALERGPPRSRELRTHTPAPVRGHLMP
jgi:hypothetical protein